MDVSFRWIECDVKLFQKNSRNFKCPNNKKSTILFYLTNITVKLTIMLIYRYLSLFMIFPSVSLSILYRINFCLFSRFRPVDILCRQMRFYSHEYKICWFAKKKRKMDDRKGQSLRSYLQIYLKTWKFLVA